MVIAETDKKKCKTCKIDLPYKKFERQNYTTKNGSAMSYRNVCKHCRLKQNRDHKNNTDYYRRYYASMVPEKKAAYIKRKSAENAARIGRSETQKKYCRSDRGIFLSYIHESNRRGRLLRGITMDLEFSIFQRLINSPCFYCGDPNARGIDRVDSEKAYTPENSVPCCKVCNCMKMDLTLETFKKRLLLLSTRLALGAF